jgi:hypothetical protein
MKKKSERGKHPSRKHRGTLQVPENQHNIRYPCYHKKKKKLINNIEGEQNLSHVVSKDASAYRALTEQLDQFKLRSIMIVEWKAFHWKISGTCAII